MSLAIPGQRSPPLAGDGLVQVRVLVFSPLRQYCEEQEDQPDHADQLPFTAPGQMASLHAFVSVNRPVHDTALSPFGSGLLQRRPLVCIPVPQVTGHWVQADH